MSLLRVILSLMVLVVIHAGALHVSDAVSDDCCAAVDDSSDSSDECPSCPQDCDDECLCCGHAPAHEPPHRPMIASAFTRVRYLPSADRSPDCAESDGREPVPRAI